MITFIMAVAATTAISSIEAFTSGILLGATIHTASRTNKVTRIKRK